MIKFIAATDSRNHLIAHCIDIKCRMIGKHIDNDFHSVTGGRIHHLFHLLACAKNLVTDFPVGWLIIVIPITLFLVEQFFRTSLGIETMLHRRSLHHSKTSIGNILHIRGNGREIPAPGM